MASSNSIDSIDLYLYQVKAHKQNIELINKETTLTNKQN